MAEPTVLGGGCLCGRIRYAARLATDEAYLCHCTMCRRATGGVSIAFCNLPKADVTWTTREPDRYASSPIAERGFCATCGTPLSFAYPDSERMDLTVGSFDDPGFFRPDHQFSIETRLAAWSDTAGLPGVRLDEHRPLVDRWMKTLGKLPD